MLRRIRLDGELFGQMVRAGHQELRRRRDEINSLNVFPVPDGDTGTNMYLSYSAGVEQIHRLPPDAPLGRMAHALSSGLLIGARGNSGVILSQLFRGFHLSWQDAVEVDAAQFAQAFTRGAEVAYKAVSRPVEGTMLTVMRKAAQAGEDSAAKPGAEIGDVVLALWRGAQAALLDTPNLLPVLRQAGVVDSGAKGLTCILEGFLRGVRGEEGADPDASGAEIYVAPEPVTAQSAADTSVEGEYGYCTEFVIRGASSARESDVRHALDPLGDSLIVVAADDIVRVHIHTGRPGQALERALGFGSLSRIKIDNMTEQQHAFTLVSPAGPGAAFHARGAETLPGSADVHRPAGLIAVAAGEGLARLFLQAGADRVVSGDRGERPSAEAIVDAVAGIGADRVFILPDHDTAPAVAQAAAELGTNRLVTVSTATVGERLAAALAFSPTAAPAENTAQMRAAASRVVSASVAPAAGGVTLAGAPVKPGEFVVFSGEEAVFATADRLAALGEALARLCGETREICTVLCAREEDVRAAAEVVDRLRVKHADVDFEVLYGGQPEYDFLLAGE